MGLACPPSLRKEPCRRTFVNVCCKESLPSLAQLLQGRAPRQENIRSCCMEETHICWVAFERHCPPGHAESPRILQVSVTPIDRKGYLQDAWITLRTCWPRNAMQDPSTRCRILQSSAGSRGILQSRTGSCKKCESPVCHPPSYPTDTPSGLTNNNFHRTATKEHSIQHVRGRPHDGHPHLGAHHAHTP